MNKTARFNVVGVEAVEEMLMRKEKSALDAAPKMLKAGADVLIRAQQDSVRREFGGKGNLARSIEATPIQSGISTGLSVEVYQQGNQPHGSQSRGGKKKKGNVPNAMVGFILEYGTSRRSPSAWMADANERSSGEVNEAMRKVWKEEMDGN